ncbi:MAG: type I methionyl aminopeptidase [Verrucomicrobiae bacterium]|nr:type I methionyl aminopeptidase [Verrucomicrobiae bacterium]
MIPIKTERDIEAMRPACEAATDIMQELVAMIAPGRTTKELDDAAVRMITERDGKSPFYRYRGSYPGHICVSINEEVVHGIPSARRIQYGDIVSLDVGIILNGWVGDTATTVPVGLVDPRVQELLMVSEKALYVAIDKARSGNRISDISRAVESLVTSHGFSVVREFVGHGVGRKLHEEPQVPNYVAPGPDPKLRPGMTIAIEPMTCLGNYEVILLEDGWTVVTRDRKQAAHFEHTVLIKKDGPEILTCPKKSQFESKVR